MRPVFYQGKAKALTFSYDDGITQDIRLVELFNKYGVKCTFNLNSGLFGVQGIANGFEKPTTHNKIEAEQVADLYKGHEVAVHTVTHPWLQYLDEDTVYDEVINDRIALEELVGYPVDGMAYPFGTYSDEVIEILRECGIRYSRTVEKTRAFGYPQDFLKWHPTLHFGDEDTNSLKEHFLALGHDGAVPRNLPIFYVWGHSYELDGNDSWEAMEEFLKDLAGKDDIYYATNGELVDYYEALQMATYSADGLMIKNNSSISLWFEDEGDIIEIKSGEVYKLA